MTNSLVLMTNPLVLMTNLLAANTESVGISRSVAASDGSCIAGLVWLDAIVNRLASVCEQISITL